MICQPCARGGDRTRGTKLIPDVDKTDTLRRGIEIGLSLARQDHSECLGCDCQHVVPTIDQLRRLGTLSTKLRAGT